MDKVDAYDKEQLQAMGWLFDEIETPDIAVRFVEQDLTSEQQTQARTNIDVKSESELATSDTFSLGLTGNGTFITDLVSALDREHYGVHLAVGADLQQGLLNDADFIAELKTKLGLT